MVAQKDAVPAPIISNDITFYFTKKFASAIYAFPVFTFLYTICIFSVVPFCILLWFPMYLDSNPEKGFDTRNTEYSAKRLTWGELQPYLFKGSRVIVDVENRTTSFRARRSWADDFLASFSSVACYESPIPMMDYLVQIILEVDSHAQLYSLDFHRQLCSMNDYLGPFLRPFDQITPYRNIWNLANYAACFSPNSRVNCSFLSVEDVSAFQAIFEYCIRYRNPIIKCYNDCMNQTEPKNCHYCEALPKNCSNQMMFDLFYRIFPKTFGMDKLYLNNFLPIWTYSSYRFQGFDVTLGNYLNLEEGIKKWSSEQKNIQLKGILMDIKRDVLLGAAISDSKLAIIAAIFVFLLIFLFSRSLIYVLAVFWLLGSSVISALAAYRIFSNEFPLLNLIVFVLLVAIGADGAFLLYSIFPKFNEMGPNAFHDCLRHTMTTMFLTQFSTVVPFLLNIFSNVVVFRRVISFIILFCWQCSSAYKLMLSFGLFAAFTLVFNYFLLISFLPSFLLIRNFYFLPIYHKLCYPFKSFKFACLVRLKLAFNAFLSDVLPITLIQGRFIWLSGLSVLLVGTGYVTMTELRLPEYNPLQLFVDANLHEWYDNNAEKLFEFVPTKIALPLSLRLVWGIKPVHVLNHFGPNKYTNASYDRSFTLSTIDELNHLAQELRYFRQLDFVNISEKYWPEKFLDWSQTLNCIENAVCCNINSKFFSNTYLDYCMRVSTSHIVTQYNDTLIYHNITFEMVGYTAMLPTRYKYSHRFNKLLSYFNDFDANLKSGKWNDAMWYTTEWTLMSVWFDLLKSIISDCRQSVFVSFVVVLIFAALMLQWHAIVAMITIFCVVVTTIGVVVSLGWVIGVLEAVILVLVVSLSFDYTLHYGSAVPYDGCARHRIQHSIQKALIPVSMAAFSSMIAGATMLFADTHAFHQVAVFLLVSTSVSFLYATFFFLPLLYIFLPKIRKCHLCENNVYQIQLGRMN